MRQVVVGGAQSLVSSATAGSWATRGLFALQTWGLLQA